MAKAEAAAAADAVAQGADSVAVGDAMDSAVAAAKIAMRRSALRFSVFVCVFYMQIAHPFCMSCTVMDEEL